MSVKSGLLELLEQHKGESLSGEQLAQEMGCTRAAVWKAVKALQSEGYVIEGVQNRGYRLSPETNVLSQEAVRLHLLDPSVKVAVFEEIDSTNREAHLRAQEEGWPQGSVVLARSQSAGRGRRGRTFFSPEGGLYLSVILRPQATLEESLLLTTAAATAVYRAVVRVCGLELDIKWVNDLYYKGRKVCGILTEAVMDFESGQIEFAIVGIGLNLRLGEGVPEELHGIIGDLCGGCETEPDINRLAAEIVNELCQESASREVSREYIQRNLIPGHNIQILDGSRSRRAKALAICPDGRLLVQEEDGTQTILSFGEVSVRREEE